MSSIYFNSQDIENRRVAIVGSGIAGTTAALYLAKQGLTVDLFEREKAIFMKSSAIAAHLYSGVQYFGDISKESIRHCMHDAISFAKSLPFCINPRPTVMAIAKKDSRRPEELEEVCRMNQKVYETECLKDPENEVFGNPSEYYKAYTQEDLLRIQRNPEGEDEPWMAAFANHTNLNELQFPVFLVREYGLDMRHAAGFMERLIQEEPKIRLHLNAEVTQVETGEDGITLHAETNKGHLKQKFNVIVDASGNNLGALEAQLDIANQRLVDIKMAGLFKYTTVGSPLPEIYILGGKGQQAGASFMSHISPIDPAKEGEEGWMVVNITTPDCTYVSDGKRGNKGKGAVAITPQECPLASDILEFQDSHLARLRNMIVKLKERHSPLAERMSPVRGIPGSVALLGGDFLGRDSAIDAHPGKRFISLNIAKGGAAVGVAQALCKEIRINKKFYKLEIDDEEGEPYFMPKDLSAAIKLTKARYLQLGFTEESSRTHRSFEEMATKQSRKSG